MKLWFESFFLLLLFHMIGAADFEDFGEGHAVKELLKHIIPIMYLDIY